MPDPVTGVIAGVSALGTAGSAAAQSSAARRAANAQQQATQASIAEQRRQFDAVQQLLRPYVDAGTPALRGLMDIAGIGGQRINAQQYLADNPDVAAEYQRVAGTGEFRTPEEFAEWHFNTFGRAEGRQVQSTDGQQAAIDLQEQSPLFQALARQGEEAIMQNASATGGLRGGNTQGALARFRPQLLNQFIEQQFGRMSGIASMGQNAAAGVGTAGMQSANNISNLMMQGGMAQAAGIGAQGQILGGALGNLGGIIAGAIPPGTFGRGAPNAMLLPSVNQTIANNPRLF